MKPKHTFSTALLKWPIVIALIILTLNSCKKALNIPPSKVSLNGDNVYTTNGSAQSVLAGLFSKMANIGDLSNGNNSLSIELGLSADELSFYGTTVSYGQLYTNNLVSTSTYSWPEIYNEIFVCNTVIAGLADPSSSQISPTVRTQLTAEAKFVRAFDYFYAVNIYGDVPLVLTTNFAVSAVMARTPQAQVYSQIIQDLTDAQASLSDNTYVTGTGAVTTDRVRPNKQTATALLARVYLYQQNWKDAEAQATAVIGSSAYVLEPNLNQVFLKGTREAIWQLDPVVPGYNNADATNLVVTIAPGPSTVLTQFPLNNLLVNAFERGDARFKNWVGQFNVAATPTTAATAYYFAYKYKAYLVNTIVAITEYPIVFRLAEQYLIRAEARAEQGNTTGAQSDLNTIRLRAGLAPTTASGQSDLLTAIAHERQIELFSEWGHRWFDLKRTKSIDAVMAVAAPLKGGTWNITKQLFPIPNADILADPHLTQNPGYSSK
jgi:hypothetical protein